MSDYLPILAAILSGIIGQALYKWGYRRGRKAASSE